MKCFRKFFNFWTIECLKNSAKLFTIFPKTKKFLCHWICSKKIGMEKYSHSEQFIVFQNLGNVGTLFENHAESFKLEKVCEFFQIVLIYYIFFLFGFVFTFSKRAILKNIWHSKFYIFSKTLYCKFVTGCTIVEWQSLEDSKFWLQFVNPFYRIYCWIPSHPKKMAYRLA